MTMAMDQSTFQTEDVRPVPVQQPTAVTSADQTVVVVVINEEVQISEQGHGRLQPQPENNTNWLLLGFFVCFTLLRRSAVEGVHPVLVQQPMESEPPEQPEVDEVVRIPEPGHGPLGFLLFMIRSLTSLALGQNRSDPFWRLIFLTAVNLVTATMIGLVFLPKALQEVHETYHRVMLTMTVVVPIIVAIKTFLATIWIAKDRDGRSNWITGLSVANVSMLAGPLVLYWVLRTYYTGN